MQMEGYKYLSSYILATVICDLTIKFCQKYVDPRSRTTDQMIQAARSGKQNIAEGYSVRFSDKTKGLAVLEEVMLGCNRAVVYLELYRDLAESGIENEFFEEKIKDLQTTRWKVMHLARSWEKFSQTQ